MSQSLFVERRWQLVLLAAVVAVATCLGWRLLWFLTDDAFIAFRYASNSLLGRGLVWNPAPFLPVEGYTSWLWVVLLRQVWAWTGIAPPDSATAISLAFGFGSLFLGFRFLDRMRLPPSWASWRLGLLALVWLGTVTNRTFLAWLSSGLETAMFGFYFTLWIYHGVAPREARVRAWVLVLSLAAALAALTRPEGWLAVVATPLLAALDWRERPERGGPALRLAQMLPLAAPAAHMLWRHATYGEWLPNTYYAKQVSSWPESGIRYLLSFALEYVLWIWLAVALWWLVRSRRLSATALVTVAVVLAHFGYYTFVVGGDHFEYRIYSHLVLLLFVSFVWLTSRVAMSPFAASLLLAIFIASSWVLPWMNYRQTRVVENRLEGVKLFRPVTQLFPTRLRLYPLVYDAIQYWLIEHYVGLRQQEHKIFVEYLRRRLPPRAEGAEVGWDERPVAALYSVGYAGWVFPNVAIIDRLGLNDYVVARSAPRPPEGWVRVMAHERHPPPGYVDCFRPNVFLESDLEIEFSFEERETPLTDAEIVACERRYRAQLRADPG